MKNTLISCGVPSSRNTDVNIIVELFSKNTALDESAINSLSCVNKMLMIECMSFVVDVSLYICEERHLTNANKLSSLKLISEISVII